MILRCPDGVGMGCFYQKHRMRHMPEAVRSVSLPSRQGKTERHLVIDDLAGLERPGRIAFDLDPGPGIDWATVCEAAVEVRDVLAPLERRYEWTVVKAFTQGVAQALAARRPERYTATVARKRRTRRIFIDYLRNGRRRVGFG